MSVAADPANARRERRAPALRVRRAVRALDRFEASVLAALGGLAMAVLAGLLVRVWRQGGVVTGADGFLVADPMQYLTWARQAGAHGLVGNLYDLRPGPRSFLHPGLLLSGGLCRLGFGPAAAYLAWKPVAVGVLFAGTLLYVRARLARADDRRLALVLALFACSPVAALVGWAGVGGANGKYAIDFVTGELWTGSYLWGYLFTAIATGLLPLALLAYERGRGDGDARGAGRGPRWGRVPALAAALGLLCAWLQPWQGATLALVLLAAEAVAVRRGRDLRAAVRDLAVPLAAIAAPLVYYFALSRLDASWELAGTVNDMPRWPWWALLLGPLPLALPAAAAYRLPAPDFGAVAVRAWPLAGLAVYFQPGGTFPFHALQGMTLPLVVLGTLALRHHLGPRPVRAAPAIALVLALAGIGTAYRVQQMADAVHVGRQPFFLTAGERAALRYLDERPEAGGVLAPVYSGIVVPAYTGREVWVGAGSWTPDFEPRRAAAEDLFAGRLDAAAAGRLVRRSGARFLYADCHGRADVTGAVGGFTDPPQRFGCATVWRVR